MQPSSCARMVILSRRHCLLSRPEVQRDAMWRHVPKKPFPYATISSFSCSLAAETPGFTGTTFLMPRDGFHMANKDE